MTHTNDTKKLYKIILIQGNQSFHFFVVLSIFYVLLANISVHIAHVYGNYFKCNKNIN